MKKSVIRLVATVMTLAMVMGLLLLMPTTAGAVEGTDMTSPKEDKYGTYIPGKGVAVPSGEEEKIWDGTVATAFAAGAGTKENPYQIQNAAEFMYLRNTVIPAGTTGGKYYVLTDNIYLNDADFTSNNLLTAPSDTFLGTLDGQGYAIYNAYAIHTETADTAYLVSLFHTVAGTVKNIDLVGFFLEMNDGKAVCGLSRILQGTVDNVHVVGITAKQYNSSKNLVAGLVAEAQPGAKITNCSVSGEITSLYTGIDAAASSGGVLAYASNGYSGKTTAVEVTGCKNYASVSNKMSTNSKSFVGSAGVVGNSVAPKLIVTDCQNFGEIYSAYPSSTANRAAALAGIVGSTQNDTTVENCTNYGAIHSKKANAQGMAGVVGMGKKVAISGCANYGTIEATTAQDSNFGTGGILGYYNNSSAELNITDTINYGAVIARSNLGGFVGKTEPAGSSNLTITATNCANYGDVTGTNTNAGGLIGYAYCSGNTTTVYVNGFVNIGNIEAPKCVGGILGKHAPSGNSGIDAMYLNTVYIGGSLTATNASDYVGTVLGVYYKAGGTYTYEGTNVYHDAVVIKGSSVMESPYGYYILNGSGKTGPARDTDSLTDGTAKAGLNAYATANGYTPWIQGETAPEYITNVTFTGATMTLGENMMLNLKLAESALTGIGVTSVTFVRNGEAAPGNANGIDGKGYYSASFACDAADLAKSASYNIVVETATATYTSTNILTYAPIEYATALYNDEKYPETQDLIEKMLSMASLSEKAKYGAESNAIATAAGNAGITLPTEYTIPENMKYYALNTEDANAAIDIIDDYAKTGADLNGNVNLVFEVTDASITKVVVTSGDVYNETFEVKDNYVTITGLGAKHIANLITIAFHDANGLVASTDFSVGNYLQTVITNAGDDTATKNLASAMVLYMVAVRDYALHAESVPMPPPATVYTVTFDSAGGTTVSAEEVIEGGTVTAPAAPTREGYTFVAWMLGGAAYDFATPVTEDITLVASWEENPVEDTVTLHKDFVGGNIRLLSQDGDTYHIQNELRDSDEWMYWAFCVEGAAGKTLTFTFDGYGGNSLSRIGYWGPAVSSDLENWDWLGSSSVATTSSSVSFTYTFAADEDKVYFAHNMLYLPQRFEKFAAENGLVIKQLCESAKGRSVPYVTIGEGEKKILIVTRQHSCESTGSFVMEGILRELLEANLPANIQIIAVPFVDYDGVIEGDQGKNQSPHDPNRDWFVNKTSIYPEVVAIKQLAIDNDILFAFDLHSPWHAGGANDALYGTYTEGYENYETFWNILDGKMTADAMDFNTVYNDSHATEKPAVSAINMFRQYMEYHGAQIATVLEIPFFGLSNEKFSNERGLAVGRCFAEAILECLPLHTVTILDKDGGTLEVQIVGNQLNATLPAAPTYTGFVFDRWSNEGKNITQDTVIQAIYVEVDTYTVTFYDKDGTVLSTQTVNAGESATAPEAPDYENFIFLGWDNVFENVTSDINVTAQYKALSNNASTMNVLQWQQNKEPNFRLELVGEKDIILYTGNKTITSDMIPDGWKFINTVQIDNNQTPKYQAVIYNPNDYTYDEAAGTYYVNAISALETKPNAGSAAFAVPLIENSTEKQFVMTIFVVNGDSVITNKTNMTSAMSAVMNAVAQKYEFASGIVVSFQASTWADDGGNVGHYASGYFSGLDDTAFISGYDLVCHYEAVTAKDDVYNTNRPYATYLLTYMKEGQIVKVNSVETINTITEGTTAITVYNGLHSSITFDTEGAEAESD